MVLPQLLKTYHNLSHIEKAWWSLPWFFFHPLLKTLELLKVVNDTLIKCFKDLWRFQVQCPKSIITFNVFFNFLAVKGSLDSWLKLNHRLKLHLVFYLKPTTTTVVWNTSSCPLSLLHDISLLYAVRTQKRSCPAWPAIAEENMIVKTHATDGFRRLFIATAVAVFL